MMIPLNNKRQRIPVEIIYVTESSGFGGAERYLLDLMDHARKVYGKVSLFMPYKRNNLSLRESLQNVSIQAEDIRQFRMLYPVNLMIALLYFRRRRGAFFHFSLTYPDSCRWMLFAAALLKMEYVITEHLVPPDPYKAGWYFFITNWLFKPLKRFTYKKAARIIAVSKGNMEILTAKYGMPGERMVVIHNGIDCALFKKDAEAAEKLREEFRIPRESIVLTNIGRLTEQKGQIYLLYAFDKLIRENPSLILILVGDGPLRGVLEKEVRKRGLSAQTRLTGFRKDVREMLSLSDIFVLSSTNEGFPFTLIEAMAAGVPPVATRVTGVPEAIVDGESGLLCKARDPGDLAEKILSLVDDSVRRKMMGLKAMQRAKDCFDVKKMIEKTFNTYSER